MVDWQTRRLPRAGRWKWNMGRIYGDGRDGRNPAVSECDFGTGRVLARQPAHGLGAFKQGEKRGALCFRADCRRQRLGSNDRAIGTTVENGVHQYCPKTRASRTAQKKWRYL